MAKDRDIPVRLPLSFLPIPGLIVLMTIVYFTVAPSVFYDPAWLIFIGNTLFVGVVSFVVCFIALRNYGVTGRIQILLLGCGVLIFGIGGVLAGIVRSLPAGANLNVTIYNTGALVGAAFHVVAAFLMLAGVSPEVGSRKRRLWLALGYGGSVLFVTLLTAASLKGLIPPFFIQGSGPTLLRQRILGAADILFVFSFLVFMATYFRNKERFLYWYACALACTAISLTAFFIESSVGSPVGWVGRFSQYLGGVYFLVSLMTAIRSAQNRGTSLDNVLTASLSGVEEKFRALAENTPDAIRRFDRDLRHIYVNAAGLRLVGRPAGAVIGKTLEEAGLPEAQCELWKDRILKVFQTGQRMEVEDYVPTESGTEFFQSHCVPEYGPGGGVANVLVVSRNLTERKQAEERLRHAQKLESIGVLAGGIAHDFNNLLTCILGNASLLQMDAAGNQEQVSAIVESSERAASLTRQLLAYAGKGQFQIADFDVSRLVRSSADLLRVSIPRNIDVELDVPRNLPAVRGDSSQIQQVVMNLVINAAEAIEDHKGGRVSISAAVRDFDARSASRVDAGIAPGRYIAITVRDNGCGMDEETKAKLFDPFFTTKFMGRGLGLAAVHGILRSHKGTITVESRPGEGSTFTVCLPSSQARAAASGHESPMKATHSATILVVDDEEPVRAFTKAALERLGHRVLLAENGRQALDLLASHAGADLVVLDIIMPVVGGAEAFSEMRRRWPELAVLVASGYSRQEGQRLGIPGDLPYIEKPYTAQTLREAIDKALLVRRVSY